MHLSRHLAVPTVLLTMTAALATAPAVRAADTPPSFRVQVTGRGPAMLLIPGLSSSGETWNSTIEHYRERFECHVVTLAGFAGVPPIDEPLMAAARRDLAAYMRGLNRPVIVGHSLGGVLALALAIDHPEAVGPLVIVDSLPFLGAAAMNVESVDAAAPQLAAMRAAFAAMTPAQYQQFAASGAATRFLVTSDANHEIVTRWSLASDPKTVGSAMTDVYGTDLRSRLGSITAPVLALGTWIGLSQQAVQYRTVISRAQVQQTFAAQFAGVPRLHFALSETSRHFIMLDEPAWMVAEMDRFLADPSAAVRDRGFGDNPAAPPR